MSLLESAIASGTFVTDAVIAATYIECGFKPRKVELYNSTDNIRHEWFTPIPDSQSIKSVALGDQTFTAAGTGITPSTGQGTGLALSGTHAFTVGSSAVTGAGTHYTLELKVGDVFNVAGVDYKVAAILSATSLTISAPAPATVAATAGVRVTGRGGGFSIGTDLVAGKTYYWVAEG